MTSENRAILFEKQGNICIITHNRPEAMNAHNYQATYEEAEAYKEFERDPDLRVAIVTGTGDRAFSAGGDLKERALDYESFLKRGRVHNPLNTLNKPVIAAVNGIAHGGGFEEALGCDIIVAAENAEFRLPEPLRGIVPGTGIHHLPRVMPFKQAMSYLLTCKPITAQEALKWGIVSEVVPRAELMDCAIRWANDILESAPLATWSIKHYVRQGMNMTIDAAMEMNSSRWVVGSEDAVEGPKAFVEKRKPVWKGQ